MDILSTGIALPKSEFLALIKERFKLETIRCKNEGKLLALYHELRQKSGANDLETIVCALWVLPRFIDFEKYD